MENPRARFQRAARAFSRVRHRSHDSRVECIIKKSDSLPSVFVTERAVQVLQRSETYYCTKGCAVKKLKITIKNSD